MSDFMTATFKTRHATEAALRDLEDIGITEDQIGLIATDETRGASFEIEKHSKAEENMSAGAGIGGVVGALFLALWQPVQHWHCPVLTSS